MITDLNRTRRYLDQLVDNIEMHKTRGEHDRVAQLPGELMDALAVLRRRTG